MEMNETNELNREMDSFRIPTEKYYDTSLEDLRSSFQKSSVMLADESIVELAEASVGEGKNGIVAKIGDSYYLYKDKEIKKITEEEANKNGYKIVDAVGVEIDWNKAAKVIKAYLNKSNSLRMPTEDSSDEIKSYNLRINYKNPKESFNKANPNVSVDTIIVNNAVENNGTDNEVKNITGIKLSRGRVFRNDNCENFPELREHVLNILRNPKNKDNLINIIYWKEPNGKYRVIIPSTTESTEEKEHYVKVGIFLGELKKESDYSNLNNLIKFLNSERGKEIIKNTLGEEYVTLFNEVNENGYKEKIDDISGFLLKNKEINMYPTENNKGYAFAYEKKDILDIRISKGKTENGLQQNSLVVESKNYDTFVKEITACNVEFVQTSNGLSNNIINPQSSTPKPHKMSRKRKSIAKTVDSSTTTTIDYKQIAESKKCQENEKVAIGRVTSISDKTSTRGKKLVRTLSCELLYPEDKNEEVSATITEENLKRFNICEGNEIYLFMSPKKDNKGFWYEAGTPIPIPNAATKESNYSAFIRNLLNSHSATKEDRARIVELLMKERDKKYVTKEQLQELLKIGGDRIIVEEGKKKPEYPEPKQTYEFLSFFSQNDGGLKNLTHDFNYGYIDYDVFMAQCKKEFEEGKEKYPKVSKRLLARIEAFAFKESPDWFIRRGKEKETIEYGWSKPSFVEWYKTNRIHPSRDTFYNKEMIIPFKESIQVRADTGNLKRLLDSLVSMVFGEIPSCKVSVSDNLKDAQFYTDVDSLGQALYQIFSTIKEYSEKNFCDEVEVDYYTEGEYKVLTVTHIDSKPTKRADDKDYSGGNTNAIRNQLMGLCNYEVCAEFPDGTYRKLILYNYEDYKKYQKDPNAKIIVSEKGGKKEITILVPLDQKTIKGYTHKMMFY